jgi:uncharacterized DUF497 family protein
MKFDLDFDWDNGNAAKCAKHGVTRNEIESVFHFDPDVSPDPVHSGVEDRFIAIGQTLAGRTIFIVFCLRNGKVRPISARYMHLKEVRRYENRAGDDN